MSTGVTNTAINDNEKIISTTTQLKVGPNPFSNTTNISFFLSKSEKISISIFDITGRLVKTLTNEQMQAGSHEIKWSINDEHGNTVPSGIYFLRFDTDGYNETKKLLILNK